MIDFDFQIKTKIYFGKDKENQVGEILKENGAHKVLIIIGQGSVKKSRLLDRVIASLTKNQISYVLLEGVRANPEVKLGNQGIELAKEEKVDFLLAIGGGSVMDTAKYIGVGYYYDGDAFDFNLHKLAPSKSLPLGVILTISASGSEMSTSCVMQNDESKIKSGFNSEVNRPVFAIENPELTYTVSPYQTACGITDIMMHTLERYFRPSDEFEPADGFALSLLKDVMKAGKVAMNNPLDYQARAILMLLSSLSHNGLTSIGKKPFMPVHQLEHPLSGLYPNVAHGAGLAILFPAWARYFYKSDLNKFDRFAKEVFDLHNEDKEKNSLEAINKLEEFFASIGMPTRLSHLEDDVDIEALANKATNNGNRVIDNYFDKPLDIEAARAIFKSCK